MNFKERVLEAKFRGLDKLFVDTCNTFNETLFDFENFLKLSEELKKLKQLNRFRKLNDPKELDRLEELSKIDRDSRLFHKMLESSLIFYPSTDGGVAVMLSGELGAIEYYGVDFKIGDNKYFIKMKQEKENIYKTLSMNGEIIFGIVGKISSGTKTKTDKVEITVSKGDEWVRDFYKILTDFNFVNSVGGDLNKWKLKEVKSNISPGGEVDKVSDINIVEEKRKELKVIGGKTLETFWGYSFQEKRRQMRWFVSKLLSLCDEPFNPYPNTTYSESLCFKFEYLEESGLFPFGIHKPDGSLFEVCREDFVGYCEAMFSELKRNIYKLKDMGFSFNSDFFEWHNAIGGPGEHNNMGFLDEFYIDIYFRPLFEAYLKFMDSNERVIENGKEKPRVSIEKIEVLEDKTEQKAIRIYINGDYEHSKDFSRGVYWGKLYELAKNKMIDKDRNVKGYFNYNPANPLFTENSGFIPSTVLKDEGGYTVPAIEITLVTQEKISRRLNSLN